MHNYHGKVDHRFIDLATQFSVFKMQKPSRWRCVGGLFQGQKVVDIFTGKNLKIKIGKQILWQCAIRQVKAY
jgi:hypothetical protein